MEDGVWVALGIEGGAGGDAEAVAEVEAEGTGVLLVDVDEADATGDSEAEERGAVAASHGVGPDEEHLDHIVAKADEGTPSAAVVPDGIDSKIGHVVAGDALAVILYVLGGEEVVGGCDGGVPYVGEGRVVAAWLDFW